MDLIDQMIEVLKRVKNCDKALNNLKMASENSLFSEKDCFNEKYKNHVHNLIKEAIEIIENKK